jgi:GNAT superfamily N-acetyltransferase
MATFRESSVDDPAAHALISEYFAVRAETYAEALGIYKPTFPTGSDFLAPHGVFLVVVDGGEDVGCGGVRELAIPGTSETRRFEIKHLWVQPRAQGHGYGRLLLDELEDRARGFGATEIVLDTNASLLAAGQLYRSSGYRNIERYNENPNATDWMLKHIP